MARAESDAPPVGAEELRALAVAAARAGGEVAQRYFRTPLHVRFKPDQSEVSEADEAAQAAIVALLCGARPHDAFIAEETLHAPDGQDLPRRPTGDELCWVIDPIDGTRNFVRGIAHFACSVGVLHAGTPVAGAIFDPVRDVMYSGSVAEGFWINHALQPQADGADGRVAVAGVGRPVVGIPSTPAQPYASLAHEWLERYVCRNFGSTALHLAMVATGELDGMLADNPRLWDVAAGYVLVRAAGGRMTTPAGAEQFPLDLRAYAGEMMPTLAGTREGYGRLRIANNEERRPN
jgi:myo-inositol-1(or 4)-monophosphatase